MPEAPILSATSPNATESGSCPEFSADTYDRYVLGLLDSQERTNVDQHVERQCPVCIKGVQRSMNLWLVFANNLEQAEPAADFRARLIRIAELSKRVLTVPRRNRRVREPAILISSLVVICLTVTLLLVFAWVAGRQAYRLNVEKEASAVRDLQNELAETQVKLNYERAHNQDLEDRQKSSGRPDSGQQHLQDQLSKALADIQQYKDSISRDKQSNSDNSTLVTALTSPGVRLLTFTNAQGVSSTAYAFVIENSKIIFVASKLPDVSAGHQYQLWLVRKAEPHYVAAGIFSPSSDEKPVVVTYEEDKSAISVMSGLLVTEEEINGSYNSPSSDKVLETPGAAAVAGPAADF